MALSNSECEPWKGNPKGVEDVSPGFKNLIIIHKYFSAIIAEEPGGFTAISPGSSDATTRGLTRMALL